MQEFKLYMLLLGAKPPGRHTEQHDIFFTISTSLKECVPGIRQFWPEGGRTTHIDAWRNVNFIGGFTLNIVSREEKNDKKNYATLFFVNLGGYKANEFEEFHYKLIIAAPDKDTAIRQAKKSAFFRHNDSPHVDDKYGIDVDDIFNVEDILPDEIRARYAIQLTPSAEAQEDEIHLGYFKLDNLDNLG
ncbi:DUF1543 domain-containing protein [Terrimonas sp. NA20]|uniref:DUF1543 domain-containing protein n=1 Tax=Terrimonas ginsenosidimutans TaxID=2908004 RepID=A0ABS9KZC6_9BACT|nr:DUF1543 domain-containing protein [Terrimonas ginsenosidimutans]MCG2617574.1 DUF1543 domain-containing protein [Terrimonas ginsenosidimutans]